MRLLILPLLLLLTRVTPAPPVPVMLPPILMYHRIDVDRPADPVGRDLTVAPQRFQEQLQMIRSLGLRAISMSELLLGLRKHESLEKTVVLTFDDGYADQARYALPLLRHAGDRATFYIVTGMLGKPNHLGWAELRRLPAAGMDIGGHGLTHDDLALMAPARQRAQIFGCLQSLRERLGVPVRTYAYPSGRFNRSTLGIVALAGIDLAVTTDPSYVIPPKNRFELTRLRIHGAWTAADFRKALQRALAHPQSVVL